MKSKTNKISTKLLPFALIIFSLIMFSCNKDVSNEKKDTKKSDTSTTLSGLDKKVEKKIVKKVKKEEIATKEVVVKTPGEKLVVKTDKDLVEVKDGKVAITAKKKGRYGTTINTIMTGDRVLIGDKKVEEKKVKPKEIEVIKGADGVKK